MPQPLEPKDSKELHLRSLAPYEDRLLSALAFFRTRRDRTTQAQHCLSMYLRQSEGRILSEVGFYAHLVKMDKLDFLELLYTDPERVERLIFEETGTHLSDIFESD